ncbi:MAG TPA: hypothetical protein VFQ30_13925 [Ktedonobacteraceae bacterium]|nr:hypothetical protein [Ktedonobacteraceae bacterium]
MRKAPECRRGDLDGRPLPTAKRIGRQSLPVGAAGQLLRSWLRATIKVAPTDFSPCAKI